jgi:uncharacterized FlaG/YvyC family protein
MMESEPYIGTSVAPIGSFNSSGMKVTNDRQQSGQKEGREKKGAHSSRTLDNVVRELNEAMHALNRDLVFSVVSENGSRIVLMKDSKRNTVIRKISPAELLEVRVGDLVGVTVDRDG